MFFLTLRNSGAWFLNIVYRKFTNVFIRSTILCASVGTSDFSFVESLTSFAVIVVAASIASFDSLMNANLLSDSCPAVNNDRPWAAMRNEGTGSAASHLLLRIIIKRGSAIGFSVSSNKMLCNCAMITWFLVSSFIPFSFSLLNHSESNDSSPAVRQHIAKVRFSSILVVSRSDAGVMGVSSETGLEHVPRRVGVLIFSRSTCMVNYVSSVGLTGRASW